MIRVQASVCRKLNSFGNLFDDDMILARGALGLMTVIEKRKQHNKEFTHRVMTERDEVRFLNPGSYHQFNVIALITENSVGPPVWCSVGAAKKPEFRQGCCVKDEKVEANSQR